MLVQGKRDYIDFHQGEEYRPPLISSKEFGTFSAALPGTVCACKDRKQLYLLAQSAHSSSHTQAGLPLLLAAHAGARFLGDLEQSPALGPHGTPACSLMRLWAVLIVIILGIQGHPIPYALHGHELLVPSVSYSTLIRTVVFVIIKNAASIIFFIFQINAS